MPKIIALMTDFGLDDIYVGVMKGVIFSIYADAQIVDLTHTITSQNIREGAFALMNSFHYFPSGTTFCVVVDPGVGSKRLPIAVKTKDYQFIAPDNGILSYTLSTLDVDYQIVTLENPAYQLTKVSNTFHGRDIFSPASAYMAKGDIPFDKFGTVLAELKMFPNPHLAYNNNRLTGEVMHIDHFGNIITSIGRLIWEDDNQLQLMPFWSNDIGTFSFDAHQANITIHSTTIHGISRAYHEVDHGAILCQIDSNGFLEIGANQDNAADRLDVKVGDRIMVKL